MDQAQRYYRRAGRTNIGMSQAAALEPDLDTLGDAGY
jgi:hypothetical protein